MLVGSYNVYTSEFSIEFNLAENTPLLFESFENVHLSINWPFHLEVCRENRQLKILYLLVTICTVLGLDDEMFARSRLAEWEEQNQSRDQCPGHHLQDCELQSVSCCISSIRPRGRLCIFMSAKLGLHLGTPDCVILRHSACNKRICTLNWSELRSTFPPLEVRT